MSTTADARSPRGCGPDPSPEIVAEPAQAEGLLLDAAVTTRCRRRVHLEHDPVLTRSESAPVDDDPGVAMRRADAAEHRATLSTCWAEALGAEFTWVPLGVGGRERARRTLAAVASGVSYVGSAELPAREGRRGGAELLVRHGGGWVPVIVVRHRVTDPGSGALTSPLTTPHPAAARADDARRVRSVVRDVLRLAHLHRMLGAAGLAPAGDGPVWAGVVGLDADAVVWLDLVAGEAGRSPLETYDRRFADRLAVATAARTSADPLAEPSRITECRSCPWWPTCEAALRERDDVSLVVRGDAALRLRGQGIGTVRELAALDPSIGLPAVEPGGEAGGDDADGSPGSGPSIDLVESVALARAWRADVPLVRRVRRPRVPRADVEVDVDMESLGEAGAYLWGVLLSGADIGLEPGYRGFATWVPVPTHDEGRSFGEFWTWLRDVRARTEARGLTLRTYCYNEQAENRWLRASAQRFAGMPGVPELDEVEAFIASDAWTDLFPLVSETFLCPHGKGLKRVAPSAGFAWRDPEAGGENSMRWYRAAVGLGGLPDAPDADAPDAGAPDLGQRVRLLTYNEDDVLATRALRSWMSSDRVLEVPYLDDL